VTKTFKDSQSAAFQRLIRSAIRNSTLTRGERDVTLAMINHWFHHNSGAKDYIHPGRKRIAKKARVSMRTTARTFAMLRAAGVLLPTEYLSGGANMATHYQVDIMALTTLCGCDWVDAFIRGNGTVTNPKIARLRGAKMAHCIIVRQKPRSKNVKPTGVFYE